MSILVQDEHLETARKAAERAGNRRDHGHRDPIAVPQPPLDHAARGEGAHPPKGIVRTRRPQQDNPVGREQQPQQPRVPP